MDENKLISQLKELKQIKPNQNWVIWNKKVVFGDYQRERTSLILLADLKLAFNLIFRYKLALSTIASFILIAGFLGLSQAALPGDVLYPVRKITEKLSVKGGEAEMVFEVANRRSDDLARVLEANTSKNLSPAISEYKASVAQVARQISRKDVKIEKKMVLEIKKLEEKREKIESLGVRIDEENSFDYAVSQLVEREINDLDGRALNEEQQEGLNDIKTKYGAGDYSAALEAILLLNAE